jgi:uncharacterized membrane protein YvbJ
MSYLVCDNCGSYYELQEGESPEDFDLACECGGRLKNKEALKSDYEIDIDTKNKFLDVNKKSVIWAVGLTGAIILFLFMYFLINLPSIMAAILSGLIVGLIMRIYLKYFL